MPNKEEEFNRIMSRILEEASSQGHSLVPVSKKRTAQEQARIYNIGRGTKGKVRTEKTGKPGDESLHQLGLATDLAFSDKRGQPSFAENQPWNLIGDLAKKHGLEWGGDWETLVDRPHVQYPTEVGPKIPEGLDITPKSDKPVSSTKMPNEKEKVARLVQKMSDAGESDDKIQEVINEYKASKKQKEAFANPILNWMNTTGAGGITKSVLGGEAPLASMKGLGGFAQGAIADLPGSIAGGLETVGGLITSPTETINNVVSGLKALPGQLAEKTVMAGSDPVAFGRSMGQLTGQPAVTAGISKIPPKPVINALGRPVEALGEFGSRKGLAGSFLPSAMYRWGAPEILKAADKAMGRGLQNVGRKMRSIGTEEPFFGDPSKAIDITPKKPTPKGLPPSKGRFTAGPEGTIDLSKPLTGEAAEDAASLSKAEKFAASKKGSKAVGEAAEDAESLRRAEEFAKSKKTPEIKVAKPKTVAEVIESIQKTGNVEFDNALARLQSLRKKARTGLTDAEFENYADAARTVRNHADMPEKLKSLWDELGAKPKAAEVTTSSDKPLDWKTDPQRKINQQKVAQAKKTGEFKPESLKFDKK